MTAPGWYSEAYDGSYKGADDYVGDLEEAAEDRT